MKERIPSVSTGFSFGFLCPPFEKKKNIANPSHNFSGNDGHKQYYDSDSPGSDPPELPCLKVLFVTNGLVYYAYSSQDNTMHGYAESRTMGN